VLTDKIKEIVLDKHGIELSDECLKSISDEVADYVNNVLDDYRYDDRDDRN
jgi:hypothetical protein